MRALCKLTHTHSHMKTSFPYAGARTRLRRHLKTLSRSALIVSLSALPTLNSLADGPALDHEIWLLDQSNTYDSDNNGSLDSGGLLYIYQGSQFAGEGVPAPTPEVLDLGGTLAAAIKTQTGSAPVRPHYISFSPGGTHALITFVATGHLIIIKSATREVVFSVDVGAQAHASNASPDGTYILVANQNGKLVQRINTDYANEVFELDNAATLDLANGFTPSGALRESTDTRPDNAAVITYPEQLTSDFAFVTLRGGGAFVVNPRTTPITIVAEYTKNTIEPAGLIAVQKGSDVFFNSGGGGASELGHQSVLYRLPWTAFSTTPGQNSQPAYPVVDTPAPTVIFDFGSIGQPSPNPNLRVQTDSHGIQFTRNQNYLWNVDRAANRIIIINPDTNAIAGEIPLVSRATGDPAPDLVRFSPSGDRAYASLRGPNPLTGNNATVNNAKGSTPGLGVFEVTNNGLSGRLRYVFRTFNRDAGGVERSDPHGIGVRIFPASS